MKHTAQPKASFKAQSWKPLQVHIRQSLSPPLNREPPFTSSNKIHPPRLKFDSNYLRSHALPSPELLISKNHSTAKKTPLSLPPLDHLPTSNPPEKQKQKYMSNVWKSTPNVAKHLPQKPPCAIHQSKQGKIFIYLSPSAASTLTYPLWSVPCTTMEIFPFKGPSSNRVTKPSNPRNSRSLFSLWHCLFVSVRTANILHFVSQTCIFAILHYNKYLRYQHSSLISISCEQ